MHSVSSGSGSTGWSEADGDPSHILARLGKRGAELVGDVVQYPQGGRVPRVLQLGLAQLQFQWEACKFALLTETPRRSLPR